MHKEVGVLRKHLLAKERAVQKLCETDKECCYVNLKINEIEDVISQVLLELEDLELKLSGLTQEVHGHQGRLDKLQENSSYRNYLLHTVNTIQKQLGDLDVEINKHARAIKRRSENASTEPNDNSSFINLKKLLKGIEGSRNVISFNLLARILTCLQNRNSQEVPIDTRDLKTESIHKTRVMILLSCNVLILKIITIPPLKVFILFKPSF